MSTTMLATIPLHLLKVAFHLALLMLAVSPMRSAEPATLQELTSAIGGYGIVTTANEEHEVSIQIHRGVDMALAAVASTSQEARTSIKLLSLHVRPASASSYRHIRYFSSLRSLRLYEANWSDELVQFIAESKSVEELWAERTGMNGEHLNGLCRALQLRVLMIGYNDIKSADIGCLANLTKLTQLSLAGLELSSTSLQCVREMKQLKWLSLTNTNVDDEIVRYVTECERLVILSLVGTKVTTDGVAQLTRVLPNTIISTGPRQNEGDMRTER